MYVKTINVSVSGLVELLSVLVKVTEAFKCELDLSRPWFPILTLQFKHCLYDVECLNPEVLNESM